LRKTGSFNASGKALLTSREPSVYFVVSKRTSASHLPLLGELIVTYFTPQGLKECESWVACNFADEPPLYPIPNDISIFPPDRNT